MLPIADPTTPQACSSNGWSQTFAATADQVCCARRGLAAYLNGWPLESDAITCLSELVTNAIEHSESGKPGGTVAVHAHLIGTRLHVTVRDQGGPWRQSRQTSSTGERGRGLTIVAALADSWGKSSGDGGRAVWFTMTCPGPAMSPGNGGGQNTRRPTDLGCPSVNSEIERFANRALTTGHDVVTGLALTRARSPPAK